MSDRDILVALLIGTIGVSVGVVSATSAAPSDTFEGFINLSVVVSVAWFFYKLDSD